MSKDLTLLSANLGKEIPRVLVLQLEQAMLHLQLVCDHQIDGVHEARKCFKKIRAVLQLLRPIDKGIYKRENRFFRDVSSDLSGLRDRQVMYETIVNVSMQLPYLKNDDDVIQVRELLKERIEMSFERPQDDNPADILCLQVRDRLAEHRARFEATVKLLGNEDLLFEGMRHTYRKSVHLYKRCFGNGVDKDLHNWRKQVKYHFYQMQLFSKCGHGITDRIKMADELGGLLGQDHDYIVLSAWLRREFSSDKRLAKLALALTSLSRENRSRERLLGQKLFAETSNAFSEHLRRKWHKNMK